MTHARMNDDCYDAYNHAANCRSLCTDPVHMVEIAKLALDRSWKSWRWSRMRKGEEVGLNVSKTRIRIYMRLIVCRKRWKMIG